MGTIMEATFASAISAANSKVEWSAADRTIPLAPSRVVAAAMRGRKVLHKYTTLR